MCSVEVLLLNGKTTRLRLRNKQFRVDGKSKSKLQHSVGIQLTEKYPHDVIFEEVRVPGDGFILDFFIPSLNLVVEVHGKQHMKHVKHFHKTKIDFHRQQDVDQKKRDFCKINCFRLVEIYDE